MEGRRCPSLNLSLISGNSRLTLGFLGVLISLLIGCAQASQEEETATPIAEPGLIPSPSPDAGTGPELNFDSRAPVKVSPGRLRAVGFATGLEGNLTPTYRSVKGIRIGLDLTVSATTARQPH